MLTNVTTISFHRGGPGGVPGAKAARRSARSAGSIAVLGGQSVGGPTASSK